ncbi:MAG: prepilin-type N-terminal cleavage/methylation domain-containing protein [Geminicoccaceae bacterium]
MISLADCDFRDQRGFTLMELLVALTLLGMLMAAMFGGVRLGTRVWQVSDEQQEVHGRTEAVHRFLEKRLEEAQPLALGTERDRTEPVFSGERHRLTLASSMPASLGPGIFLLDLELERQEGNERLRDLVVSWRPLTTPGAAGTVDDRGERVLIEGIADMVIGYFGAWDGGPARGWHDQWREDEFLPELIRLELQFPPDDPRQWLPLTVSPMIDAWYDPKS